MQTGPFGLQQSATARWRIEAIRAENSLRFMLCI
jgi:hypothetical protein